MYLNIVSHCLQKPNINTNTYRMSLWHRWYIVPVSPLPVSRNQLLPLIRDCAFTARPRGGLLKAPSQRLSVCLLSLFYSRNLCCCSHGREHREELLLIPTGKSLLIMMMMMKIMMIMMMIMRMMVMMVLMVLMMQIQLDPEQVLTCAAPWGSLFWCKINFYG